MKNILFFLFFFSGLVATAQEDSTKITITLKQKHHAFLVAFMPQKDGAEQIKYMIQVADSLEIDPVADTLTNPEGFFAVTVSLPLVPYMFKAIGSQQERLVAQYNAEIEDALIPQLYARLPLLMQVAAIREENNQERNLIINHNGVKFIKAIKQ